MRAHGTVTKYVNDKCRCAQCRGAARAYSKQRALKELRGEDRLVPVDRVREHVAALQAAGMSKRSIALSAGYRTHGALLLVLKNDRVRVATQERILAVRVDSDDRPEAYIDATGTRRRLQALGAIGWPHRAIADRLGSDPGTILDVRQGQDRVRRRTADAVARLYDELWDQPGPSRKVVVAARRLGWAPPLAWDDDEIDDPAAEPYQGREARRTTQELLDDLDHTWEQHHGDLRRAAQRLGVRFDSLHRTMHRRGLIVGLDPDTGHALIGRAS